MASKLFTATDYVEGTNTDLSLTYTSQANLTHKFEGTLIIGLSAPPGQALPLTLSVGSLPEVTLGWITQSGIGFVPIEFIAPPDCAVVFRLGAAGNNISASLYVQGHSLNPC